MERIAKSEETYSLDLDYPSIGETIKSERMVVVKEDNSYNMFIFALEFPALVVVEKNVPLEIVDVFIREIKNQRKERFGIFKPKKPDIPNAEDEAWKHYIK